MFILNSLNLIFVWRLYCYFWKKNHSKIWKPLKEDNYQSNVFFFRFFFHETSGTVVITANQVFFEGFTTHGFIYRLAVFDKAIYPIYFSVSNVVHNVTQNTFSHINHKIYVIISTPRTLKKFVANHPVTWLF